MKIISPHSWKCYSCETDLHIGASAVFVPEKGVIILGGIEKKTMVVSKSVLLFKLKRNGDRLEPQKEKPLPYMNKARVRPGVAYHDGRVFAAGSEVGRYFDIECIQYPSHAPQWTAVSLIDHSPCSNISLISLSNILCLIRKYQNISFN